MPRLVADIPARLFFIAVSHISPYDRLVNDATYGDGSDQPHIRLLCEISIVPNVLQRESFCLQFIFHRLVQITPASMLNKSTTLQWCLVVISTRNVEPVELEMVIHLVTVRDRAT